MHTQLLHLLPLRFLLSQTCNLSAPPLLPYTPLPPSLPVRGLAAADIWSGCLVIDWQVMRRLKGRWRQEQVFSTVFLASTKLPCPSLLQRITLLSPSLTHSLTHSFPPSFHRPPPPFSLPERRGLCNPSHGDTVGHRLSLYGEKHMSHGNK